MGPCVHGRVHLAFVAKREYMSLSGTRHDLSEWDRRNGNVRLTSLDEYVQNLFRTWYIVLL